MFKRLAIHFLLVFLFAFTQIGVATHEISHYADPAKHSQQDKNSPAEQCGQCIAYAQVASGLQAQPFLLPNSDARFETTSHVNFSHYATHHAAYSARAPPITINT